MLNVSEANEWLANFDQVELFKIEYDDLNACYNLTLVFSKDLMNTSSQKLNVIFYYVSSLNLNDSFQSNFQQFMSLVIEKDSNRWENVNYEVRQIEDDNLMFKCKSFSAFLM
ncbi:hypothetical protein [Acinetobacter tjernbergiae]|uniref:Uncharacterized protein n=1 Tax=Acinetobacter tjernbergiae DSM 14971 = CIP 107465 TaxID=1120928 RepID=V2V7S1_9GAMM|nr:hypothetical protein [Acinetobacter tjernbergiae]ESK56911.1 hypothetical protein F990_00679 [Acinetobacter tjernbergiae DSM 14971 = CIP 107465]